MNKYTCYPVNSLMDHDRSYIARLWIPYQFIKSFICIPLYPLIYHPFIHSMITNKQYDNGDNGYTSSIFIQLNGDDDKYGYDYDYYHKYKYAEFWKLFGLNNIFALIRSLFLICLYDQQDAQNNYIWCLSLFFTLSSVISLLGMISKFISHNNITFLFRWFCFAAFYIGYVTSLRWISSMNYEHTQFVMISMIKFMFIKIIVFSAPFSIWLGFRKM